MAVLVFHSLAEMARSLRRSRGQTLDSLQVEAVEAMKLRRPEERFAALNRLFLDVGHQERREPRRAAVFRAALLDVMLDTLRAWSRQDRVLAPAITSMISNYGGMRQDPSLDGEFEEEVEAVRAALTAG